MNDSKFWQDVDLPGEVDEELALEGVTWTNDPEFIRAILENDFEEDKLTCVNNMIHPQQKGEQK